jgi:hypothetical protein
VILVSALAHIGNLITFGCKFRQVRATTPPTANVGMSFARRHGSYDNGLAKLVRQRLTYNLSWTSTTSAIDNLHGAKDFTKALDLSVCVLGFKT